MKIGFDKTMSLSYNNEWAKYKWFEREKIWMCRPDSCSTRFFTIYPDVKRTMNDQELAIFLLKWGQNESTT